jgi:hypothetical protein
MAAITSILISIAISAALSIGMRLISSLLSQASHQSQYGGQLQTAQDPGTQLTLPQAAAPQRIVFGTRRVSGTIVFAHCTDNNSVLHLVIAWAGHEVDSYGRLYFGDEEVPVSGTGVTGRFAGYVGIVDRFGTEDQTAVTELIGNAPGLWTTDHRGAGIAYSYIALIWNRDLFGQFSIDRIWREVNGMKVYDPRTHTTVFSDNAALCVAAWLNSDKFGRGVPYDEIDTDELIASANVDDEDVPLSLRGTEKRYTCNAVLTSDTPFVDNLNKLLSANHGECSQLGGLWAIRSARWEEPELSFDESDFRAAFTVTNGQGREGFNAIKGKFANPDKNYQPDDFPAITSTAYEIEDGGDGTGLGRVFQDVSLDCTTSASMAQRIARIDLRGARQPLAFTAQLKLRGLRAVVGKNVAIDFAMLGWEAKPFRVKRLRYVPGFGPDGQPGVIGVDLDLIETTSTIYDWTSSEEITTDPAPNTTLPSTDPLPPSNLTATETLYATRAGGGVKARVTLAWDESADAFVQSGGWYVAEYKLSSASVWTPLPRVDIGTSIDILDVDPGTYDFRVWAYQWTGARAAIAPVIMARSIAGLGDPPEAPANLTLVPNGNFVVVRWDTPVDLDVEIGGTIVFKHASQLTGATWADGVTISKPLTAGLTKAELPLVAGTYMAKFRDASGVWSENFASFATAQVGALTFSTIVGGSLVEDPTFAGTKTNCAVTSGKLKLGGSGLFSAIPLLSAIPSVGYWGGVVTSGTYGWSGKIDLGSKTRCRLTISKTTLLLNIFDLVSERSGDVSTWAQFGGDVSGLEADARIECRTTDDDPNGTPVWSDWARIEVGEFNCRGFDLRTQLESFDPSFDIEVSALAALAEEVV